MDITNQVVLVTGANRGLGKAFTEAFLEAGAAKVYAGARRQDAITDPRLTPVRLDVTSSSDIHDAIRDCQDVTVLVNNAGILLKSQMLTPGGEDALRQELEVNVFGTLNMARAFAPILGANGGGAIVNMLSVVTWFTSPFHSTYCASKHAALAVTDALRMELKEQGTHVMAVHAGFIDTDMAAHFTQPKVTAQQVAARTIEGLRADADQVLADARSEMIWATMRKDPAILRAEMQRQWDDRDRQ
ncbi:MAG: SDR family oxidoreductase [Vicinamibacterales bacterium]